MSTLLAPFPKALVSLVVPCFDEADAFPHLREALTELRAGLAGRYTVELILVDDGSRDPTWDLIREFAAAEPWVRGVALSRNFGHQAALTCGLMAASGAAVVSLDADLQDPPGVVLDMLAAWEAGADVVYAVRRSRAGESRFSAKLFYRAAARLGAENLRADAGDFRLMSRRSLDALLSLPERHRFIRGMVGWVGYRTAEVHYDRAARVAGATKYPLRKMLRLAADAVVSSSTVPLRFPYYFALSVSGLCLSYVAFQAARHVLTGREFVPGWPSLMLAVITFGCLNLCCLGIVGEYLGRIYEQVKGRPLYLVREVVNPKSRQVGPPQSRSA